MPLDFKQAIDGGTVSYEDGLKAPEEYAPARKVRVELTFSTSEGGSDNADEIVARIGDLAKAQVHRLLTGTAPNLQVVGGPEGGADASPPAQRRTRRTAAQIEADNAAAAAAKASGGTDPSGPQTNTGGGGAQTSVEDFDPTAGGEPAGDGAKDPADITDEWETPAADEAKPVTDADLNSAVQKKNAEIANPDAIRALIGGYNPDPTQVFQLRQIPADQRAEFLTKLAALTKAA